MVYPVTVKGISTPPFITFREVVSICTHGISLRYMVGLLYPKDSLYIYEFTLPTCNVIVFFSPATIVWEEVENAAFNVAVVELMIL